MRSAIDFGDLEHGLDVLAEVANRKEWENVRRSADLLLSDIEFVGGTQANEVKRLLGQISMFPDDATPCFLGEVRASLHALASEFATIFGYDLQKRSKTLRDAGVTGNNEKSKNALKKVKEWQDEADRMWRLRPDRKKEDVAQEVCEICGGGTPSYIQSKIRKRKK